MDLDSYACDALAMDMGVAKYNVESRNGENKYIILNETISSEQYAIGFMKGNTELRDQVQKTLDEMMKDGTIARIAEKYSQYGIPDSIILKNK